jgi:hypothetical protein
MDGSDYIAMLFPRQGLMGMMPAGGILRQLQEVVRNGPFAEACQYRKRLTWNGFARIFSIPFRLSMKE